MSQRTKLWIATAVLLVLAAACYWYGVEHQSHIAKALFWTLILACPLMHLFGHSGHRHRSKKRSRSF
ncbi:MAG: DUF2933 domain-containing protein [Stagnimonas sp.]|nr:DUF2933 domain-containing protein [Stagnimonas sp.]